jgi:hypothetical protein
LCKVYQRAQDFVDSLLCGKNFGHVGTEKYKVAAFPVGLKILATDSLA